MDTYILTCIHTQLTGRQIEYTRLPYKNVFIALGHGQKCLKVAVLDRSLAWKRGRVLFWDFFSVFKRLYLSFGVA